MKRALSLVIMGALAAMSVVLIQELASVQAAICMASSAPTSDPQSAISNLSVMDGANAEDWSVQQNLQSGDVQYGDRAYAFTSVPAIVAGSEWIRTANGSKAYTDNPLVTFTVTRDATVYVGVDDRMGKPSWMDASWTDSGYTLVNNEGTPRIFRLYQKPYSANATVSLGPNGSTKYGMYAVIVK